jgi:hypothetical protein
MRKNLTRCLSSNTFTPSEFEVHFFEIFERRHVMKRTSVLLLSFLLMAGAASDVLGSKIGLGGFAGMNIPIVQDDASSGTLFGFKGRFELLPNLGAEAFFTALDQGESSIEVWGKDMVVDAGSISSFGLNLILGSMSSEGGAHFHVAGGIASYSFNRDGVPDESRFGYNFGPGIEIGLGKVSLEVSSRFHIITLDGGGSRKNLGVSGGLNYYFDFGKKH